MSSRNRTLLWLLAVATVALLAGAAVGWTMRSGIGLSNDSRSYVSIAAGLTSRAQGIAPGPNEVLNRRFPPGFPAAIAIVDAALGVGPLATGRAMNVACAIASTLLVAWLVWRASRERWRALLAAALFALSAGTLGTHVYLWSEPTFTLWMLLTACALEAYLRDRGARRWLAAAAVFAACAVFTRYAAVAMVMAAAPVVLLRSPRPRWLDRFVDAFVFGVAPAAAMLFMQLAIPQTGAGIGPRTITFEPVGWAKLDAGLQTFGTWIAWHAPTPGLARATGAAAIALWIYLLARPRRALTNPALAFPWAYLAVYPVFLITSISFFDKLTPLDLRILSPLHTMAIVVGCATLGGRSRTTAVVASLLVLAQLASSAYYLANIRHTGLGYGSLRWKESKTIAVVRTLPKRPPVFTTHHLALDFLSGRNVHEWPALPHGTPKSLDAAAEQRAIARAVLPMLDSVRAAGGRGYLALVKWPKPSKRFVTEAQLARFFDLRVIAKHPDGRVIKIEGIVGDVRPTTKPPEPPTTRSRAAAKRKKTATKKR